MDVIQWEKDSKGVRRTVIDRYSCIIGNHDKEYQPYIFHDGKAVTLGSFHQVEGAMKAVTDYIDRKEGRIEDGRTKADA